MMIIFFERVELVLFHPRPRPSQEREPQKESESKAETRNVSVDDILSAIHKAYDESILCARNCKEPKPIGAIRLDNEKKDNRRSAWPIWKFHQEDSHGFQFNRYRGWDNRQFVNTRKKLSSLQSNCGHSRSLCCQDERMDGKVCTPLGGRQRRNL